jgi:ABC-2 type transport system ATP-binding protein
VTVSSTESDLLEVSGLSPAQIGDTARDLGIALHELTPQRASLEEAFMEMTRDDVEYHGHLAAEAIRATDATRTTLEGDRS